MSTTSECGTYEDNLSQKNEIIVGKFKATTKSKLKKELNISQADPNPTSLQRDISFQ